MASTDPTAATDRQEFRARFPWRWHVLAWALLIPWQVYGLVMMQGLARTGESAAWSGNPWPAWLELSVVPLFALASTGVGLLEARRASVLLDRRGLVVIDWRRKQQHIRWDDVLWLRTARWAGRSGGIMRVGTRTGSVRFAYPIDRPETLRQEIIARAGLTEVQRGRFRFTYRRTQGPAPQAESHVPPPLRTPPGAV
jgi:hypothetical protein